MHRIQTALAAVDDRTGFRRWGPDANPVIRHVKRQDQRTRLSLRRTIWVAFALGMVGLMVSTWKVLTLTSFDEVGAWTMFLYLVGWTLLVGSPVLSAMSASSHTSRALAGERFDLVYITPLDNLALVRALVFDVVYQARRRLAMLVILLPFMTVYTFYYFLELDYTFYQYTYYDYSVPGYWSVVGPTLWLLGIMLGLWGYTALGTVLGVRMGIFRSSSFSSSLSALVSMTLIQLSPCMCFSALMWLIADRSVTDPVAEGLFYIVPVVFLIVPWLLAWQLIRHTAWVWRRERGA